MVASGLEGCPDPQVGNSALLGQARELANLAKRIHLNSKSRFTSTSYPNFCVYFEEEVLFCDFQDNAVPNFFTPFRAGDSLLTKPNSLPCRAPSCTLIHAPITHHNRVRDKHSFPPPQIGIFWIQPSKKRATPSRHLE